MEPRPLSSGLGPRPKCTVGVSHPVDTGESRGHVATDWLMREKQAGNCPGAKEGQIPDGLQIHIKIILKKL